jgi:uncharacterized membrane protein YozB (DUF420 family)
MKSKIKKYFLLFIAIFPFAPLIAFAATKPTDFKSLLGVFMNLFSLIIPVLISLAILAFLSGVAMYIWKGASETERSKGKQFMFWGVVGIFVMVSFLGLIEILQDTFFGAGEVFQNTNNSVPVDVGGGFYYDF